MVIELFFGITALIGFILFLIKRNVKIFEINFIVINFIILYLYLFGILRILNVGYISLLIIGNTLTIMYIFLKLFKQNDLTYLFLYSIIVLSFLIVLLYFPKDIKILDIDDLAIWGQNSRIVYLNNNLWNSQDSNFYKSYPPAGALLHFAAAKTLGWSEYLVFVTQVVWIFSSVQFMASRLIKSKAINYLSFLLIFPIYSFLGISMLNINMDAILGLQFGAVCSIIFSLIKEESFKRDQTFLLIFIAVLSIIKSSGFFLFPSIFVVLIFSLIDISKRRKILLIRNTLIVFVLSYLSWQFYLNLNRLPNSQGEYRFERLFNAEGHVIIAKIIISLTNKIFDVNPYGYRMLWGTSVFGFLLLILLITSLLKALLKKSNFRFEVSLIVSSVPYILALAATYMFLSPDREAMDTAAFWRYLSTYLVAICCLVIFSNFSDIYDDNKLGSRYVVYTLSLMYLYTNISLTNSFSFNRDYLYKRSDVENYVANFLKFNKTKSDVYFISQNTSGFESYLFHYLNLPSNSNYWCWSFGDIYNPNDLWTCKTNLESELVNYDYLVVHYGDPNLHNFYPKLFDMENPNFNAIFKINNTENGIKLTKIFD